ncbi:hypothetical protein J2T57_003583 [Natronocella acetinitrilica]|uniref:Uncharacterized protein n=1 Tax=Natronocella acetinitrilica TaxID=414046 RepID=A0AAE3G9U3_9GAMM|nr:hypothetical protein [Natronocella acetinitrilica]MCP1676422.1 hypothetical protein [Natronocella acetinitrilica]
MVAASEFEKVFSTLLGVAGRRTFHLLLLSYLECPSAPSATAEGLLEGFHAFVGRSQFARSLPHVGAMARLDWALHCARASSPTRGLSPRQLPRLEPTSLRYCAFDVHEGASLVLVSPAHFGLWQANVNGPRPLGDRSLEGFDAVLFSRGGDEVQLTACAGQVGVLLDALRDGLTLEEAVRYALLTGQRFDLAAALRVLMNAGVVTALTCRPALTSLRNSDRFLPVL